MSRRNSYLLGGLAVVVGIVLLVAAIVGSSSDGGEDQSAGAGRTAPEVPVTTGSGPSPGSGAGESSGATAEGAAIGRELARRRPVQAPDFSARVIHDGSVSGDLAEAFSSARSGDELTLSRLRGTPVVLYLFSSRCTPCRADSRLVEATWKRWGPRGVLFLGASVNEPAQSAEAAIRQYRLTYPAVSDEGGQIPERYGATALPYVFFISADGDIVGEVAGSPSVRQLELGARATESGEPFGSEQGGTRVPLG